MKDDRGNLDLTKIIEDLKREVYQLKAELSRAKEDHQYDNLVHRRELDLLRNPIKKFRDKGII